MQTPQKEQEDNLSHFVLGQNVFGVLPTGFGNWYILMPMIYEAFFNLTSWESIIIVVSPLVGLVYNQMKGCLVHAVTSGVQRSLKSTTNKSLMVISKSCTSLLRCLLVQKDTSWRQISI